MRLMSIWERTLSQISLEMDSSKSSILFSVWLMCLEIVQINFRPFRREGRVSSITGSSPLEMFLNWRSRVVRNLTKSLACA